MTTTAKAPRARPRKRKSRELIAAEMRLARAICGEPVPPVTIDDLVAAVDELHVDALELAELRGLIDTHRAWSDPIRPGPDPDPETDHEVIERLAGDAERLRPLVAVLAAMIRRAAREVTPRLRDGLLEDLARELRDAGVDEAGRAVGGERG